MDPCTAGLRPLAWESEHFGFPVLAITRPDLQPPELVTLLREARGRGAHLVCWPGARHCLVPSSILNAFHGRLADHKVTYACHAPGELLQGPQRADRFLVGAYEGVELSARLRELAIAAGAYSRFFRDNGFPRSRAEAMYEVWMASSVRRELADVVFVARSAETPDEICGTATVACAGRQARIGLIAVATDCRGCGLGRQLMRAVHAFACRRGVACIEVVTQADNEGACRLYERCGYRVASLIHYYHFWLGKMRQVA